MSSEPGIVLGYHYSCIDGSYSLLVGYLFLKHLIMTTKNLTIE